MLRGLLYNVIYTVVDSIKCRLAILYNLYVAKEDSGLLYVY